MDKLKSQVFQLVQELKDKKISTDDFLSKIKDFFQSDTERKVNEFTLKMISRGRIKILLPMDSSDKEYEEEIENFCSSLKSAAFLNLKTQKLS